MYEMARNPSNNHCHYNAVNRVILVRRLHPHANLFPLYMRQMLISPIHYQSQQSRLAEPSLLKERQPVHGYEVQFGSSMLE